MIKDNIFLQTASWRRQESLQLWDYRETKLLKNYPSVQTDHCLYYGAQFLGGSHFMAAGSNQNVFKIKDKRLTTELGRVKNLDRGVFCLDHRQIQLKPQNMDPLIYYAVISEFYGKY